MSILEIRGICLIT